ncbi:MAG TPA: GntG family PLP-dependent aldolase [Polyangiaceae bacterium]|nr:GntG family PLP-dependent aldolase [Polyangiaceae bacterium]
MTTPDVFDLRSDTVTRPTAAMREAMARAEVGDDVYGEDPTVRRLEERTAELLGMEAALFVPSGTMANQIALMLHTRRGDEVIGGEGTHAATFESGAASALAGVQFRVAGTGGLYTAEELERAVQPPGIMYARTALAVVENTHNRAGGRVFAHAEVLRIARVARRRGLSLHLDGARLWNAAAATGQRERELAAPFDSASVCYSKGLGAPVGSALCAARPLIEEARRLRKMLGGGMRQAGVLAAAALYALENHRTRLGEDHLAARRIAERVAAARGASVDVGAVETNIVNVRLLEAKADAVVTEARRRGVLVNATAPDRLRAVTHLDAPKERAADGAERLAQAIEAVLYGPEARG